MPAQITVLLLQIHHLFIYLVMFPQFKHAVEKLAVCWKCSSSYMKANLSTTPCQSIRPFVGSNFCVPLSATKNNKQTKTILNGRVSSLATKVGDRGYRFFSSKRLLLGSDKALTMTLFNPGT